MREEENLKSDGTDERPEEIKSEEIMSEDISPEDELTHEIETDENPQEQDEMQMKINELNDKYLRLYSEFDNYRRRTAKEKTELILNGNADIVRDLLSTVDDFERAIKNNAESNDADAIKEGFQLIYNKFLNTLYGKGLKPMDSIGEDFDIEHHEAITNIPVDKNQKGKVVDVIEKGYYLNDKVLRYAKVVVGQ